MTYVLARDTDSVSYHIDHSAGVTTLRCFRERDGVRFPLPGNGRRFTNRDEARLWAVAQGYLRPYVPLGKRS